jgi:hypothetical protein
MNRKNRRDKCASPDAAGHSPENQKKQHGSDIMQKDIGEMVATWPQSINLTIRHVAQGRERVPQTGVTVGQHPFESIDSESVAHLLIFVNVSVVIEVDEVVTERLTKNDPDDGGEKNADRNRDSAIVSLADLRRSGRHL